MPPAPMAAEISYGPRRVPGEKRMCMTVGALYARPGPFSNAARGCRQRNVAAANAGPPQRLAQFTIQGTVAAQCVVQGSSSCGEGSLLRSPAFAPSLQPLVRVPDAETVRLHTCHRPIALAWHLPVARFFSIP